MDATHRASRGARPSVGAIGMEILGVCAIAVAAWLWLAAPARSRMNSLGSGPHRATSIRRRREARRTADDTGVLIAQAPVVADLLATAVSAGATTHEALSVVADAVDDPIREKVRSVAAAVQFGAGPHEAWSDWLDVPALSPIALAVIRSQHSGSPVSSVLDAAAADMRQAHRADVEARARAAGVRAVAPLALCFLPAFLLVGVVPVVAGFAGSMFS